MFIRLFSSDNFFKIILMTLYQAIILAIVQGLTEFLPISSSGHLVFLQKLMRFEKPPVFFDVLVHLATLIAIIFYFRKEIINFFKIPRHFFLIALATLPAATSGLFLESKIESLFNSFLFVGFFWLINASLLLSLKFIKKESLKQTSSLKWLDVFIVGCFQALSLFPGVSRSGATITAGLWRQFSPETALQFSFFLALPAIFGALFLQALNLQLNRLPSLPACLLSMFLAALVGYLSLLTLEKILKKGKFFYFGFYCFILGITSLVFSFVFY